MKAIRVARFGGPEVLELVDSDEPRLEPGLVLVRVKAAGVNPVECYIRSGTYTRKPELPYTPGSDGAGVVEAAGPGVPGLKPGDRVYTAGTISGTYAELVLCKPGRLFALPERLSFAQGAALGVPYGTAWRALFHRARAQAGQTVLVHGASGGVGTAVLQLCRARGLRAAGTAGTPEGRALALAQGAEACFDHKAPGYEKELLEWTGGRGFDVIVEMLASENLTRDLALLAQRGKLVVVGSRGALTFDPRLTMTKDADVLGMSLLNASEGEIADLHAGLAPLLASGALAPVIAAELPLAQASEAHRRIMSPGAKGKLVLLP